MRGILNTIIQSLFSEIVALVVYGNVSSMWKYATSQLKVYRNVIC